MTIIQYPHRKIYKEDQTADQDTNLLRMRPSVRGELDCLKRDNADINEALTLQGKVRLNATMETIETALLWLRRMIEDVIGDD